MLHLDLATLGAMSVVVVGHVLYGLPVRRDGRRLVSLHNGDDFQPSDAPPRPERLAGLRIVSADGAMAARAVAHEGVVAVDVTQVTAPSWLVVETSPTFIELAPEAFARYLGHEGLTAVIAARDGAGAATPGREIYSKHVKVAVPDAGAFHAPPPLAGLPVEIQPEGPVETGGPLALSVVVDGRPGADLQVRVHHKPRADAVPREAACLRTDGAGRVVVVIDAPGLWRLHAIDMQRHDDAAAADWRSRWACLVFEV